MYKYEFYFDWYNESKDDIFEFLPFISLYHCFRGKRGELYFTWLFLTTGFHWYKEENESTPQGGKGGIRTHEAPLSKRPVPMKRHYRILTGYKGNEHGTKLLYYKEKE